MSENDGSANSSFTFSSADRARDDRARNNVAPSEYFTFAKKQVKSRSFLASSSIPIRRIRKDTRDYGAKDANDHHLRQDELTRRVFDEDARAAPGRAHEEKT